jgi:uncharacterized protein
VGKKSICVLFGLLAMLPVVVAEVIPPAPKQYFNDYANVVSPTTTAELNRKLEQFERDTSSQILVAVYPKMQSDSSIEDYTVRVAHSWGVGQKGKDNGAVLFVFIQDRKMYLQVGYGLEGALPDALAKRIIENEIKPYFKNGDFDGGLRAGVAAILQATQGEYKGTGRTASKETPVPVGLIVLVVGIVFLVVIGRLLSASAAGTVYTRGGRVGRSGLGPMFWGGFFGGGFGGGGGGGGGGGFSSGGGFSGGGGGFGGGGAGGSW